MDKSDYDIEDEDAFKYRWYSIHEETWCNGPGINMLNYRHKKS